MLILLLAFCNACNTNTNSENNAATQDSLIIEAGPSVNDREDGIGTSDNRNGGHSDTIKNEPGNELPDISGTHNLTLQWIGWDIPGNAVIKKTGQDTYTISGSQTGNDQRLEVEGTLKMITPLELEFDGTIVTKSISTNNVEPCIKRGKQTFLSTKGRKYWRLQNMVNCEGGRVLDYVDIYF